MAIGLVRQSLQNGLQVHAAGSIVASFMLIFATKCSLAAQLWGENSENTISLQNVYMYVVYLHTDL